MRAVLSASERIDLRKVKAILGSGDVHLASEQVLAGAYPEFELGAVPRLGAPGTTWYSWTSVCVTQSRSCSRRGRMSIPCESRPPTSPRSPARGSPTSARTEDAGPTGRQRSCANETQGSGAGHLQRARLRSRQVNADIELGRIAGIRIGVNWSWLIVFGLIVWTLASGVFPSQNPALSKGTYIAMAIVAAVVFFASLLLHELGHAIQARREGVEIEGITLWLFGGVAQFKGMFPSAGAEFRIAIAGPLVSLGLGILFVVVSVFAGLPGTADGVVAWLGYINLTLLVFNLLPALPLDGGRVLRSALWYFKGDFPWATRIAADIGRGFGYLFIGAGLFLLIFQSSFSGAWLAFIGWFLLQAAAGEARYVATAQALSGLRVSDSDGARPGHRPGRSQPRAVHGRGRLVAALHDLSRARRRSSGRSPRLPISRCGPAQRVGRAPCA